MIFNRPHAVQKIRLFQHILNHRVVCSGGGGTTEKASTSITGPRLPRRFGSSQNLNSSLRSGFGNGDLRKDDKRIKTQTRGSVCGRDN